MGLNPYLKFKFELNKDGDVSNPKPTFVLRLNYCKNFLGVYLFAEL